MQPKSNASTLQKPSQKKKEEEKKNSIRSSALPNEVENEVFDEHKLKYKLLRVAIDAVDFWLVESGAALQLWASNFFTYRKNFIKNELLWFNFYFRFHQ